MIKSKSPRPKPWFDRYEHIYSSKVIVIGGGISGAATAYSLTKRGYQVILYEQNEQLAAAASGNYQAILYGNFSTHYTPLNELSLIGFRYGHNLIAQFLSEQAAEFAKCGLIQLALSPQEFKSQSDLAKYMSKGFCHIVNQQQIEQLANIQVNSSSGLYFPDGLWLHPPSLVKKLLDLPNINIMLKSKIDKLEQNNNGEWQLIRDDKIIDLARNVVLCNADSVNQFNVTRELNLRKIRGQISIANYDEPACFSAAQAHNSLKTILCASGYITPNRHNKYTIGATFDFKNIHTEITLEDHIKNIHAAQSISDSFKNINLNDLTGQAAIRASTYDYMPLVGPVAAYSQFKSCYSKLAKDKNAWLTNECPYYKGLYINAAHGAKGMLTAPICGEIIANYIDNTLMPCSEHLRLALHPNRLYVRELVKINSAKLS